MSKTSDAIITEINSIKTLAKKLNIKQPTFEKLVAESIESILDVKQKMFLITTEISKKIQPAIDELRPILKKINDLHEQITPETTPQEKQNIDNQIITLSNEYFKKRDTFMNNALARNFDKEIILPLTIAHKNCMKYFKTPSAPAINSEKRKLNKRKKDLSLKSANYSLHLKTKYLDIPRIFEKIRIATKSKDIWKIVKATTQDFERTTIRIRIIKNMQEL